MKVRFTARALAEAKRIKTWWLENRPAAPDLFDDEVTAAVEQIASMPTSGTIYPSKVGRLVRRVLLPETENHVYYTVTKNEVVLLSFWGVPRGRGPTL